jgi:succinate dehydrogenase / fumarate reductase flavoprotein subunit
MQKGTVTTVSRRDFLKFAALGTASVTALSALNGCTDGGSGAPSNPSGDHAAVNSDSQFEVIETDFLVLGAGNGATAVAEQALDEGLHVTVVDKGTYRHSGVSGMSWDCFALSIPKESAIKTYLSYQLNTTAMQNALDFDPQPNKFVYDANKGQSLPSRDEEGKIVPFIEEGRCEGQFFRREQDHLVEKRTVSVFDRTMITDLLINEGRCVGVMGIHLPTGNFRIFRSKATVVATGGCTWIYGWFTVSANTIGSPDNTADVDMAGFRHGAGIGDSEYAQYDVVSSYPSGLAVVFGAGVCGDAQEAHTIIDRNGELIFPDPTDEKIRDRVYFNQQLGKAIADGRGTDNGGVYINVGDSHIRYGNERNIPLLQKFGVDPRTEKIEAVPEMYEKGGAMVVDNNMMTEFEGLFHSRGGGSNGENGGVKAHFNRIYAPYTAHCAVEYVKNAPELDSIDWIPAIEEYQRLQGILATAASSNTANGIRPHVIRQNIQRATKKGLSVYRSTEVMKEAIEEFKRIRSEELPQMVVSESSPTFNKEWKEAIENINMLDCAEMSVRASLAREETRGMYLRAEFPQRDDDNWACMLVCRKDGDEMAFEKVEL